MGSQSQLDAPPSERRILLETIGIRDMKLSFTGPRSMRRTEMFGSSLNLDATAHPAVPPVRKVSA